MSKSSNTGLIIGGLLLLGSAAVFAFKKKGDEIKKLAVTISDVSAKISGAIGALINKNVIITLNLSVYNPNENPVQFQKFLGNIYYNNAIISNIDTSKAVLLPARQTVKIPVQVSIPLLKFGVNVLNVLNKLLDKTQIFITITGILYTENLRIPITHKIDLNLFK